MPQEFDSGTVPKAIDVIERIVGGDMTPFHIDDPGPNPPGAEQFDRLSGPSLGDKAIGKCPADVGPNFDRSFHVQTYSAATSGPY